MDRLPPLNAVRAFEAAARHCSVTAAANELHVTPGAVSRQVHALEEFLGVALFERGHRQIKLTRRGDEYYRTVAKLLELLHDATRRIKKGAQKKQLRIRAYTTFAIRWLIPRLSSFHAAHPRIEVLLTASLQPVDFARDDLDGAIRLGPGDWPGVNAYRLAPNILAPVCSPALLRSGTSLKRPADLRPTRYCTRLRARTTGTTGSRQWGRPRRRFARGAELRELGDGISGRDRGAGRGDRAAVPRRGGHLPSKRLVMPFRRRRWIWVRSRTTW